MSIRSRVFVIGLVATSLSSLWADAPRPHPRLLADSADIARARAWVGSSPWYRSVMEEHRAEIDRFIARRPVYVSPVKQTYQYKMYTCPAHDVELLYEESRPFAHRCPRDTAEEFRGGKYDAAWAGWYNRRLADHLVWMGILYQVYGDSRYAEAGREILMQFADLYLTYPTANTILGPAHVFFGTLSESFWGVDMAYGYDLLYDFPGFRGADHRKLRDSLFYPLARITQLFPESASNRQLWYNNVSAAVGFLYGDRELIDFALSGKYGFEWQLGSALPASGFWPEWSGYHFVALRGMIHLAEMARHNGVDLYHRSIAGRSMKLMFDSPFELILPNFEFPRCKDSGGGNLLEYATYYEVGYAVYRDTRYLALLTLTNTPRGTQVVGEESGLGRSRSPITVFQLVPDLRPDSAALYRDRSTDLEGNGFAILRSGSGDERRYLYLDYGIMGGEHGHPDRLQIGYYARGRNWVVDPLNESYFNPNLQLWYRQTIAHNTLVVDQTSQSWANGEGRFFGALPRFQAASGGSSTVYPGARLVRTVVQAGDYFLDLFDVSAAEARTLDLPLHGSGTVSVDGVSLRPERPDLFGPEPGVPGYDQFRDVRSGPADGAWRAVFASGDGEKLALRVIGEPGTRVFTAVTPPLGGFYKQMVKDARPLPMVLARRVGRATRFASLIHAFGASEEVRGFERGTAANAYRVLRRDGTDLLVADPAGSRYSLVCVRGGRPTFCAFFNQRALEHEGVPLLSSPAVLRGAECAWEGRTARITVEGPFVSLRVAGAGVTEVEVNGRPAAFRREGRFVVLSQSEHPVLELVRPEDSTLFCGTAGRVRVRVWNPTGGAIRGRLSTEPDSAWQELVGSQMQWWGGVVNLLPTNKSGVQRRLSPARFHAGGDWARSVARDSIEIPAGRSFETEVRLDVPADAPAVAVPLRLSFGVTRVRRLFAVRPPVEADVMLASGRKQLLRVTVRNNTPGPRRARVALTVAPEWSLDGAREREVLVAARGSTSLDIPCRLTGYAARNQLSPVRLGVSSEGYAAETERDLYVTVARFAAAPPSLDGSWRGWDRTHPATVDSASQICKLLFGSQPWGGGQDLSARVSVMYDSTYLYVGADVTDDIVIPHWDFPARSYPWDTDCLEVVLDTRTGSDQGTDPPTPGLFRHLSMAEHRVTEFGAEKWRGAGAGGPTLPKPRLVPGAETYFTRREGGYAMICRYPLASLGGFVARPGGKMGFDVAVNDNDGTTYRKNMHIWAGFTANQTWWDMGTIGALLFGPVQTATKGSGISE